MVIEKTGDLIGKGMSFAIVLGRFNELVTGKLLEGALDCLQRHGVETEKIAVYRVPGSFEIPQAAKRLATTDIDGIICAGALIRGDTPHFDLLAGQVVKDISNVALSSGMPVSFGIITADTQEQALERAGSKAGNKGWQAAMSVLEMANLFNKIG